MLEKDNVIFVIVFGRKKKKMLKILISKYSKLCSDF